MFSRLALLASFLAAATAEYGCSSFAQLTHTSSGCPANQGNPDCSFIQANAAQFCSTTATSWEIINGPNCNLRGASYGCIYAAGLYSTTDQFCCPLIVTGGAPNVTVTATASASASASASVTATGSTSVTVSTSSSPSPSPSPSASVTATVTETVSTSSSPSASASTSANPTVTTSSSPSASALTTATATPTKSVQLLTNFTHIHNLSAVNQDKILTQTETIGMGIGISIGIIMLLGCCYYVCVIVRRKRETEKLELENPSQIQVRQPRGATNLEIRTPRARGESKV